MAKGKGGRRILFILSAGEARPDFNRAVFQSRYSTGFTHQVKVMLSTIYLKMPPEHRTVLHKGFESFKKPITTALHDEVALNTMVQEDSWKTK